METRVFVLVIWLLASVVAATAQPFLVEGQILDAQTREPLVGAHVFISGSQNGIVSDMHGRFTFSGFSGKTVLTISYVGYESALTEVYPNEQQSIRIYLSPVAVEIGDVLLVTASRTGGRDQNHSHINTKTAEDYMQNVSGVDMLKRANFAHEPIIRGQQAGRVDVLIDGMRLTPACVDGMDPQTAYIETDNLASIEIEKGQGSLLSSGSAGSVNFGMTRPRLNSNLTLQAETGFQSVSGQQLYQASVSKGTEKFGYRISGTYRNAGDYHDGKGNRLINSGFSKGNILFTGLYAMDDSHTFSVRYIGDFAGSIGYPALIMDTRRADAHIAGVDHNWNQPHGLINRVTTRAYYNQVSHWMDDYDRDVADREVMRNMYMPMYGETQTYGFSSKAGGFSEDYFIEVGAEVYRRNAFADMWMYHLNPSVSDMYLVNLGDVSQTNAAFSIQYSRFLGHGWTLGADGALETGFFGLGEESAKRTFGAEYPGLENMNREFVTYRAGLDMEKKLNQRMSIELRLSVGSRMPSHMELYSYYVYQPLDGYFYHGNPGLNPEKSFQADISLNWETADKLLSAGTTVWVNRMTDYISGLAVDNMFSRYHNTGTAVLAGLEADIVVRPASGWMLKNNLSYTYGQHVGLNEALPMIPSMKGVHSVSGNVGFGSIEARVRWAASQKRIAENNSRETPTDGWIVLDLKTETVIGNYLTLTMGIDNIFNHYYTEHLSVNELPSPGRNLYGSLRVRI